MAPKGIRRPTTRSERPLLWIGVSVLSAGAILAFAYAGLRALQGRNTVPSSFFLASMLGTIAVAASVATFFYSLRKRTLQERVPGTMMTWFKSHIYLGLLAGAAAIVHVMAVPRRNVFSMGKLTGITFAVLIASGIAWRIVYRQVPPRVAARVGNLARKDMRRRQEEARLALDKIAAGRSAEFQSAVRELAAGKPAAELIAAVKGLDVAEVGAWQEAVEESGRLVRAGARERRQGSYARMLQGWRLIHLPLAALFVGFVLVHVVEVFGGGQRFVSEPQRTFAGSADCATCHSQIVNEWKLSMHRDAQTSTVTVAQTLVALARNPDFEKACVNCHGPIASKFSDRPVFPLLQPDPLDNPTGVEDEGVTCVVCHSMAEHPGELAGFEDLPLGTRGATQLGDFFGPPLADPPPGPTLPTPARSVL